MSESRKLSGQEAQDPHETLESMADPTSSSSSPTSSSLPPQSLPVKKDLAGVEELMAEKPSASGISLNEGAVPATAQVASSLEKKIRRAERFGVPVLLSEEEKRNSRAERFGTGAPPTRKDLGISEEQKRKARAERFGLSGNSTDENAKKKARLERFSQNPNPNTLEGEKRKARTIRLSGASNSSSETNGKKVTMAEKEGGNG